MSQIFPKATSSFMKARHIIMIEIVNVPQIHPHPSCCITVLCRHKIIL